MLYLHCGWPHTGTTSFQAAMSNNSHELAEAGILYPKRWMRGDAHHRVPDFFADPDGGHLVEGFLGYLGANCDRTVLISTEFLTHALPPEEGRGSLSKLLDQVRRVTEVTCLWTLRCVGEFNVPIGGGSEVKPGQADQPIVVGEPDWDAMEGYQSWLNRLRAMREIEDILGEGTIYTRYDRTGSHHDELLDAIGAPQGLKEEISAALQGRQRLNMRMAKKAATAAMFADAISARTGVKVTWGSVLAAWHSGELRFADDEPLHRIHSDIRREAHRRALQTSRAVGFDAYGDLLSDVEIAPSEPAVLDPSALTAADLDLLVAVCGRQSSVSE